MRSKRRSHDASNPDGGCSILHEDLARHRREAAWTAVGDDDAFGGLEAPVVEPQAGHEVEGHAWLQLGDVAAAQAHGALAPVGRIAEPDGRSEALRVGKGGARTWRFPWWPDQ